MELNLMLLVSERCARELELGLAPLSLSTPAGA
jgi:hypothetical protein